MNRREAGKQRAEQFVTELARGLKREGSVGSLPWWSTGAPELNGVDKPGDMTVHLRICKGKSWRSIGFAGSDIDGCVDDSQVLKKYEGEIAEILAEL